MRSPSMPSSTFAWRSRFGAERRGCVVHVQRPQTVEPDPRPHLLQHRRHLLRLADVDAGDEEVAGVEADAEALVAVESGDDRRQLLERAADRTAGAGRVLEQEPGRVRAVLEHLAQSGHAALEPGVEARPEVRADVEDDAVRLDRARRVDGCDHRREALPVNDVVRGGEVAEVERVHQHRPDPRLGAELPEAGQILLRMLGEAPRTRTLREQLHGVGPDLDRPVERALDPA